MEQIKEYASEDADITFQLYNYLVPGLKEIQAYDLYNNIEGKLITVLADLEMAGVNIDAEYLNHYSVELGNRIVELERKIYQEAGSEFNINSPRQVGDLLFGTMKIPYRWAKPNKVNIQQMKPNYPN